MTPEQRQTILDQLIDLFQTDSRIASVLIVGSGAFGFTDDYSDIDLAVVAYDELDAVYADWWSRLNEAFSVLSYFRAPARYLYGLLLTGFLEVDLGFNSLTTLIARRGHWKIVFDRSAQVESIMQASWANRHAPDMEETYTHLVTSIWHYIMHVTVAIQRGQVWRAYSDLGDIREQTVRLAGLRYDLDTKRFREVDRLPVDLLGSLQATLPASLQPDELQRALRAAVECFFREAYCMDAALGLKLAPIYEAQMREYLRGGEHAQGYS
jgi:predicted nucleotidyltransferase